MIKRLKYIFIPVLAVFLMSHNVFAVDMSPNVHPIWANANPTCAFYIPATDVWQNNAFNNNTTNQTYSVSKINCDYPQGLNTVKTYAVYSFRVDNFAYDNSADSGWLASKIASVSGSADWGVVGQQVSSMGSTGWQIDVYLYSTKASNGGTFQIFNPIYANEIMYLKPNERIYFVGASYWQMTTENDFEYDYNSILNSISAKLSEGNGYSYAMNLNLKTIITHISDINDKLDNLSQNTADAINDGQEEATQGAADNSSTAGDTSSSDATSATSSLLSVIGRGIGAITSATPSNCKINGNMGNLDVGTIDLCANPVPTFVAVIGSFIAVALVLPLVIILFNRFISIIRSFQN